ncbi:MAG: hypothetical protein U0176_10475 [Bacteroidia bacterium]
MQHQELDSAGIIDEVMVAEPIHRESEAAWNSSSNEQRHVAESESRSLWRSWMGWAMLLGALLGLGWLGRRYPLGSDVPRVKLQFSRIRKPGRKRGRRARKPKQTQDFWDIVTVAIGILILLVGLSGGIMLCNLILGTIWVGFGWATLAVTLPFLLVATTFLVLALVGLADINDMMRGRSTFARGIGGIGAGCATILFLIVGVPAALLLGGLLTWLGLLLFLQPVSFGLAIGLFLIMAALVVPAWVLSEDFFDV